jgi:hypothetical protein
VESAQLRHQWRRLHYLPAAARDRVQLVFHRGAQKRDDATRFSFKDSSGLLECVTLVRALVTFGDLDDVEAKSAALKDLVRRWMIATSGGG